MASPAAFGAVESYLRDVWNVTPIFFENEIAEAPTDGPWVLVEMTGALYAQASIGGDTADGNLWREEGTLWLHVMIPAFTGTSVGRAHAWQLAQLLTRQPIPELIFRDAAIGAGEPAVKINGNWGAMTVTIDWERDE